MGESNSLTVVKERNYVMGGQMGEIGIYGCN